MKRYRKHAILHAFPKGISQLRRIDKYEALLVAQEIKRRKRKKIACVLPLMGAVRTQRL